MKKITLLLCFIISTSYCASSQTFNYQAAVRNNTGDLVANQAIGVQIEILQGSASGTAVYTETHSATSNAHGIVNLAIGSGTTTDTFSAINWSTQNYWLGIAVDITGGTTYVIIGSSQLLSVPYANYASSSGDKTFSTTTNVTSNAPGTIATDDFVFGSTQLDDIGGTNDDNIRMYFDKSKGAFRVGNPLDDFGQSTVWNTANTGDYSVAMGRYSSVQGTAAAAFGTGNSAGGENAFTAGVNNLASRPSTIALGADNSVSGYYAVGLGRGSQATSYGQHTIGLFSEGFFSTDNNYVATDPLFVVGNGISDISRSNALVMRKNGNTTLNGQLTIDGDNTGAGVGYTLPAQDGAANQIMQTNGSGAVSWVNTPSTSFSTTANVTSNAPGNIATDDFVFGSTQLDSAPGNQDNERMFFDKSKGAFRAGSAEDEEWNNTNIGQYSGAFGIDNLASAYGSFATGGGNSATGRNSVALGSANIASGYESIALGDFSKAESRGQISLGISNTAVAGNPTTHVATDRLFVIGNGINSTNRDALVMLKNGNTTLNGQLTIDGDNTGSGIGYTLPAQDGAANQIMSTDGAGVLSWINAPSAADNLGNHVATQDIFLQNNHIRLRGVGDTFHGMGWYGSYNSTVIDGPVITGYQGGGLGTNDVANNRLALSWDNNRNVTISEAYTLPNTDGTANQVLQTNGSGTASWSSSVSATSVTTDALTVNSLPAFSADLDGTQVISGAGTTSFSTLGNWRTSDAALPASLYDNGNHFNETTGEFTAPYNGFYYFTAQIRFDDITTGWMRLVFAVNGSLSLENGMHAIADGESGNRFQTLNIGGVLKLNANDTVAVSVNSATDDSWSVVGESGFNGYLISRF